MKTIYLLPVILIALGVSFGFVQKKDTPPVNKPAEITWMSLEDALSASKKDGKKILVDFYTDWCGWCKRMDRDTYTNAAVVKYINDNYHAVKFNAEKYKENIALKDQTFKFLPDAGRRGIHEFAARVMNGRPSYPSTAFLDAEHNVITNVPGYHKADEMLMILSFLAEEAYKTTTWPKYQVAYRNR